MKSRWLSISGIAFLSFLSNCTYNDLVSGKTVPVSSIDYLMFGHLGGFCMECDVVYKIVDGKLFGASHQMISDPDAIQLTELPTSSYNLVSLLTRQIPMPLVAGSTTSINIVGTPFPDVGSMYLEVSQNKKVYRWYIRSADLPSDLQAFIDSVQDALGKLK